MAVTQTTILAAGRDANRSEAIELDAGAECLIGVFTDGSDAGDQNLPAGVVYPVVVATPGDDMTVFLLSKEHPSYILRGPGEYYIDRPALDASAAKVGFYKNT